MTHLLVSHPACARDVNPIGHPERPQRLEAITRMLQRTELWERLPREEAVPAAADALRAVHASRHVEHVRRLSERGGGAIDLDTFVGPHSWEAAAAAAGAAVQAVDAVASGRAQTAFSLTRPPGHHASRDVAMGFCLFNNVALATHLAADRYGLERILLLDWDVHHGNGTQDIFYRDGRVTFVSLHQEHWFPGTGFADETGEGAGEGRTLNIPVPPETGNEGYRTLFEEIVIPLGDQWRPQLVVVSAGYDAHIDDPLGAMHVTAAGFGTMAHLVMEGAKRWCGGRVAAVLEGGYYLAALADSVAATIESMTGEPVPLANASSPPRETPYAAIRARAKEIRSIAGQYWNL